MLYELSLQSTLYETGELNLELISWDPAPRWGSAKGTRSLSFVKHINTNLPFQELQLAIDRALAEIYVEAENRLPGFFSHLQLGKPYEKPGRSVDSDFSY